ncbi:MAG: TfoX/Sxy family protein [Bacteroidia bacterium]
MKSDLSDHINIGKDTESKLIGVGIDSFAKLKAVGSEKAFLRLQALDPGACLDLLYGLEGAILGIKWHKLPKEKKEALLHFHQLATKE